MNMSKAMRFPFAGEGWAGKIAIGGVLLLVPIVGWFFITGYFVEVVRRVAGGYSNPMPEWDEWGTKFVEGLLGQVLMLIWMVLLFVPFMIIALPLGLAGGDDAASAISGIAGVLAAIALYFFMPAFIGRFATTGQFRAGLQVGEVWSMIRRNLGSYLGNWLLAGLIMLVAALLLGAIGAVACGIGLIFTQFYWNLFQSHLLGQLYQILNR